MDKGEAARELEVSLSTLDRMIRKGEVEVEREGRRVYVKLPGPRYPSDRELLRQARATVEQLERTVRELTDRAIGCHRPGGLVADRLAVWVHIAAGMPPGVTEDH